MLQNNFKPVELIDQLGPLGDGMNSGVAPLLLKPNQMAMAVNLTVRSTYAHPRPPFQVRNMTVAGAALIASALAEGPFQGCAFYNPDNGVESLICVIAGRVFQVFVTILPVTVNEITIPGDPNTANVPQAWLWQSEKWMIINDGVLNPVFFDGTTSTRSNYAVPIKYTTLTTADFIVPAVGATVTASVVSTLDMEIGSILSFKDIGTFLVQQIPTGSTVTLVNQTGQEGRTVPYTAVTPIKTEVSWVKAGLDLPPGKMGVYGMGRNWICLVDGRSFIASDLVGGSSGTVQESYRDAVLKISENNYLAGGGFFQVPVSGGQIRAMIFATTLDSSLGQGPLQVFTNSCAFSCQTPIDRLAWQDVTNPILTQSLISNGAMSQNSTIIANSDILFRSVDGIRSLILARREFNTWGNVPISDEIYDTLVQDDLDLLVFGSAIAWDNRMLMTIRPAQADEGVYHSGLAVINYDPLSSLRGKEPAVYDGLWTGLNILQMTLGEFEETQRAFAFCFNVTSGAIELYEFLKNDFPAKDNGNRDIVCEFQSAAMFNLPDGDGHARDLKRLIDGEIYVDQIPSGVTANFQVLYRPDQWPCWVPWYAWSECAGQTAGTYKPQFRPRMGLGEPSSAPCDVTTNRPLREGYTFQIRVIWSNCRFLGAKFRAVTVPQQQYAPQIQLPLCPPTGNPNAITEIVVGDTIIWGEWAQTLPPNFTANDILNVLQDGDFPIGPRICLISETWILGHIDLESPQTSQPTYRVYAILAGYADTVQLPAGTTAVTLPSAGQKYQANLLILGQLFDIYVLANADPGPFTVAGSNQFRIIHP